MLLSSVLLAAMFLPQAGTIAPPADLTLPPETASLITILEGRGVQIYTCSEHDGGHVWTLTAPEAQLYNLATGKSQGHHDAGPTWTLEDGSSIHGSVLTKKPAVSASDVPWLLLKAEPAGNTGGLLTPVNYVRRYNTHGGLPPSPTCSAAEAGHTLRVPYSASYAFYTVPQ